jgi:hypothetical protein
MDFYLSPLSLTFSSFESRVRDNLDKKNIKYFNVRTKPGNLVTLNLVSGGEVTFTANKDILDQIASLQLILSRLTIEDKKLKTLDFRFASPVVSYN